MMGTGPVTTTQSTELLELLSRCDPLELQTSAKEELPVISDQLADAHAEIEKITTLGSRSIQAHLGMASSMMRM